jgi:DNA-binding transcriptional MocR family regulator
MSSFSKLIAPGLRAGYMIGDPDLLARLGRAAEDTYISPSYLSHAIAYEWCRRGLLPSHIEELKALYAPRLDACLNAIDRYLPEVVCTRPDGGFFVSITLPEDVSNQAVCQAATRHDLVLADGRAFFPDGGGEDFMRLPFCALTPAEIAEGVRRLAQAIQEVRGNSQPGA